MFLKAFLSHGARRLLGKFEQQNPMKQKWSTSWIYHSKWIAALTLQSQASLALLTIEGLELELHLGKWAQQHQDDATRPRV
jgi:hypothetical protein